MKNKTIYAILTFSIILGLMISSIAFGRVLPALSEPITSGGHANDIANKPLITVHELTAADVETFLDGIVPLQLDREQVVNLTDERQHILRFFSDACRRYYLLPESAS